MTKLTQVFILAGGYGSRLGELTNVTPKPMLKVAGEPFISHKLREARSSGIERVVLCVGYLGEVIREFVGDGAKWNLEVQYSFDGHKPIGTFEALKNASRLFAEDSHVLVTYGDSLVNTPYSNLIDQRMLVRPEQSLITWSIPRNEPSSSFNIALGEGSFVKYGRNSQAVGVEHGLSLISLSEVNSGHEKVENLSDFFQIQSERNHLLGVRIYEEFIEIGTPEALQKAEFCILNSKL